MSYQRGSRKKGKMTKQRINAQHASNGFTKIDNLLQRGIKLNTTMGMIQRANSERNDRHNKIMARRRRLAA